MTSDHGALKTHFNSIPKREIGRTNNISAFQIELEVHESSAAKSRLRLRPPFERVTKCDRQSLPRFIPFRERAGKRKEGRNEDSGITGMAACQAGTAPHWTIAYLTKRT